MFKTSPFVFFSALIFISAAFFIIAPSVLYADGSPKTPETVFGDEDLEYDEENEYMIPDPIQPWNEMMYAFNDRLYFYFLKPVAQGYAYVVPAEIRGFVDNFFENLKAPIKIVNSILQGRLDKAGSEFTSFLINSTVGLGGLGNPAGKHAELVRGDEDLGQTLAVYGISDGFYIVWPVLGPSTLRDSVGLVGDYFTDPLTYIIQDDEITYAMMGLDAVNSTSLRIGDYEALKKAAFDPYTAIKDGYLQMRLKEINE